MKFSVKEPAGLATFTEKIFNGKLFFFCAVNAYGTSTQSVWKIKTNSSSGILKTIFQNGSYLLLFEKRKL